MNNTVYVIEGTPKTEEGFGCPKISSEGYTLMITVDCGISRD